MQRACPACACTHQRVPGCGRFEQPWSGRRDTSSAPGIAAPVDCGCSCANARRIGRGRAPATRSVELCKGAHAVQQQSHPQMSVCSGWLSAADEDLAHIEAHLQKLQLGHGLPQQLLRFAARSAVRSRLPPQPLMKTSQVSAADTVQYLPCTGPPASQSLCDSAP